LNFSCIHSNKKAANRSLSLRIAARPSSSLTSRNIKKLLDPKNPLFEKELANYFMNVKDFLLPDRLGGRIDPPNKGLSFSEKII